ncbi:uncharacterized protein LOC122867079 [Siniperca chuatsi]|uniref:uncharacterized protein LOC122867079 n=1 Tax=Siniperca chuatsi TaxID=119488 RepID=UPI001CE0A59D|nr:uncharacterized protein LOC122867079 [Siniperca chuatsi]
MVLIYYMDHRNENRQLVTREQRQTSQTSSWWLWTFEIQLICSPSSEAKGCTDGILGGSNFQPIPQFSTPMTDNTRLNGCSAKEGNCAADSGVLASVEGERWQAIMNLGLTFDLLLTTTSPAEGCHRGSARMVCSCHLPQHCPPAFQEDFTTALTCLVSDCIPASACLLSSGSWRSAVCIQSTGFQPYLHTPGSSLHVLLNKRNLLLHTRCPGRAFGPSPGIP